MPTSCSSAARDQAALVVLAHAEMLRERDRETGDKEAVAIAVGVMAADGRQPFTQRGLLDGFENLVFGFHDVAECQRNSRRKLLEYLDHHRVRGGNALFKALPLAVVSNPLLSGNAERMRCRIPSASNGRDIVSVAPSAQACIDPW